MGMITNEGVALVENQGRGMRIETYQSQLALVLSLMNSGAIGSKPFSGYGSNEHKAALDEVEKQLAVVRERIEQFNAVETVDVS